jgi:predicted nuclease of predicted toxin-antitoxin system
VKARLYLDEDIIPDLARMLRAYGLDAISVHETGALGLSDEEQLARASAANRVLLTSNYGDFRRIALDWARAGRSHPGIIISYHQYSRREIGTMARAVLALLNTVTAENLKDSVQVLDPFRPSANGPTGPSG